MSTLSQRREIFKQLPESVQEAMTSMDTAEKVQEIGKKYKLHIDKMGELGNEIGLVMLGLVKPNQFVDDLVNKLEVDHDTAVAIVNETSEQIFYPVREELKKIHARDPLEQIEEAASNISKEDILNEIENPTPAQAVVKEAPVVQPIFKAPANVEAIIDVRNELPAPNAPLIDQTEAQKAAATPPHQEAIDRKLSTPSATPVVVEGRKVSLKKNYTSDPYREPLQ